MGGMPGGLAAKPKLGLVSTAADASEGLSSHSGSGGARRKREAAGLSEDEEVLLRGRDRAAFVGESSAGIVAVKRRDA